MLFFMGYNNEGYINNRIGFVEKLYPHYIFFLNFNNAKSDFTLEMEYN